jgi:hypothetical protein
MKPVVTILAAMLCLPAGVWAQSTLSFPRAMSPADFQNTGFAVVNPGTANATVLFTLFGADGTPKNTITQTIPGRGQLSKLGSELFPGAQPAGWIQATSSATGLQGFWLTGDFSSFADGAETAPSSSELVIPLVGPQSEINVVNTGGADIVVVIHLLGDDGGDLGVAPYPQKIAANGFFKSDVLAIFSPIDNFPAASHIRIECKCANANPFAATLIARGVFPGPESAVVNGVPASTSTATIDFPHVVDGPQGSVNWQSIIGVTNLSSTQPVDVMITFSPLGGVPVTGQWTLPPNGGLRAKARDLLSLLPGLQDGWVSVASSNGRPITGYITYASSPLGGVAAVPAQTSAQQSLLFCHIADLPPFYTGLALLNTNSTAANVSVFAMNRDGSLVGKFSLTIPPATKVAQLLSQWIPQTQTRVSDGGFVFVQSDVPLFGLELFFTRDLHVLANVSAARIVSGITYVPPAQ